MLKESRFLIAEFRARNPHFARLFYRHYDIRKEILQNVRNGCPSDSPAIEKLTRKKLRLEVELRAIMRSETRD